MIYKSLRGALWGFKSFPNARDELFRFVYNIMDDFLSVLTECIALQEIVSSISIFISFSTHL